MPYDYMLTVSTKPKGLSMPFTLAHPAAVLPLIRLLGRYGVLSALVIGSIAPDLAYMIPVNVARHESHSVMGLFWFCIPAGLITYVTYHLFLKRPLLGLAPEFVSVKLGAYAVRFQSMPSARWYLVVLCLLVGAITHVVWDAFTHGGGPGVEAFAVLKFQIFSIRGYPIYLYKVLQHGSTFFGVLVLAWFCYQWLRLAPVDPEALPFMTSPLQRVVAYVGITAVPVMVGLWSGVSGIGDADWLFEFQAFAGRAVFAALPAFALTLLFYGSWWHINRRLAR